MTFYGQSDLNLYNCDGAFLASEIASNSTDKIQLLNNFFGIDMTAEELWIKGRLGGWSQDEANNSNMTHIYRESHKIFLEILTRI